MDCNSIDPKLASTSYTDNRSNITLHAATNGAGFMTARQYFYTSARTLQFLMICQITSSHSDGINM